MQLLKVRLDHSLNCVVLSNEEDSHCSLNDLEEFMDRSALQLKDIAQKMNSNGEFSKRGG